MPWTDTCCRPVRPSVQGREGLEPTCFFSFTISLILRKVSMAPWRQSERPYIVLSTPTFPFVMPPSDRKIRACQKDVEKPKPTQESTRIRVRQGPESNVWSTTWALSFRLDLLVPPRPISKTVLRPKRLESASRPQTIAVKNWAAVKLALHQRRRWLVSSDTHTGERHHDGRQHHTVRHRLG